MQLRFGIFPSPAVEDLEVTMTAVEVADDGGLDLVGIQDHPYVDRFLDVMTLITWLAAATDAITFLPDVANLPLRPPAVLAKQAASLDTLTGGRFELGLGAGGTGTPSLRSVATAEPPAKRSPQPEKRSP